MYRETNLRSVLKTFSYRAIGTGATSLIFYFLTGQVNLAILAGGLEIVSKLVIYFLHEKLWGYIKIGIEEIKPSVIWFTGLSGSGKSTIAENVIDKLKAKGYKVEHLDGDKIRDLFPTTGFTRNDRDLHIRRVGLLAHFLQRNGIFVVASLISPYEETRKFVRGICENFIEVYISTPLEECEKRDVKGLYARARRGEIKHFTGIDEPFEVPSNPEITIDASKILLKESTDMILTQVNNIILLGE